MDFLYVFVLSLAVWLMSIMGAIKYHFLGLPVILLNIGFFVGIVITNEFPDWRIYFILQIILTSLFAILGLIGGD